MTSFGRRSGKRPAIVIVGPCASGKTTLATRLRDLGFNARVCGQEHSAVRDLWRKMEPDVLVVLDIDLDTLRSRRSPSWPEWFFRVQRTRLAGAYAAADVVIDTALTAPDDVVAAVLAAVESGSDINWAKDSFRA